MTCESVASIGLSLEKGSVAEVFFDREFRSLVLVFLLVREEKLFFLVFLRTSEKRAFEDLFTTLMEASFAAQNLLAFGAVLELVGEGEMLLQFVLFDVPRAAELAVEFDVEMDSSLMPPQPFPPTEEFVAVQTLVMTVGVLLLDVSIEFLGFLEELVAFETEEMVFGLREIHFN